MTELTPRREATRLRLIEAGIREFGRRGIDATSVEQLCEAAGFSRGAFYSNFATKEELCLAILDYITERQLQLFGEQAHTISEGIDVVEAVQHVLAARHADRDVDLFVMELRLRALRDPEFESLLAEGVARVTPAFAEIVSLALERARVELVIDADDLFHVLEALFVYRAPGEGEELSTRLLAIAAQHLTRPSAVG